MPSPARTAKRALNDWDLSVPTRMSPKCYGWMMKQEDEIIFRSDSASRPISLSIGIITAAKLASHRASVRAQESIAHREESVKGKRHIATTAPAHAANHATATNYDVEVLKPTRKSKATMRPTSERRKVRWNFAKLATMNVDESKQSGNTKNEEKERREREQAEKDSDEHYRNARRQQKTVKIDLFLAAVGAKTIDGQAKKQKDKKGGDLPDPIKAVCKSSLRTTKDLRAAAAAASETRSKTISRNLVWRELRGPKREPPYGSLRAQGPGRQVPTYLPPHPQSEPDAMNKYQWQLNTSSKKNIAEGTKMPRFGERHRPWTVA